MLYTPVLTTAPADPVIGTQPDLAPVGEIVNPGSGEAVEAGVTVEPVVFTEDDYGIRSVSLKADGVAVESKVHAPYAFTWTPTAAEIGTSVQLEATITDSGGQVDDQRHHGPRGDVGRRSRGQRSAKRPRPRKREEKAGDHESGRRRREGG